MYVKHYFTRLIMDSDLAEPSRINGDASGNLSMVGEDSNSNAARTDLNKALDRVDDGILLNKLHKVKLTESSKACVTTASDR